MSMKSWSKSGFGYALTTDINKIYAFLQKRNLIKDDFEREDMEKDIFNPEWDFVEEGSTAEAIAGAINEETGYTCFLGYNSTEDTKPHIGYGPEYPWFMIGQDHRAKKADIERILKEYGKELDITEEPDYFTIEYYG